MKILAVQVKQTTRVLRRPLLSFAFASSAILLNGMGQPAQAQSAQLWSDVTPGIGATSVALDPSGDAFVTGSFDNYTIETMEYKASGGPMWSQKFSLPGGTTQLTPISVALDPSGNVYVGAYETTSGGSSSWLILRYDPTGNMIWNKSYPFGPGGGDTLAGMKIDGSGNLCLTGTAQGQSLYVTSKIGPDGTVLWSTDYAGFGGFNIPDAIALDSGGNVYVTGQSFDPNPSVQAVYGTVKYSSTGSQIWAQRYATAFGSAYAAAIAVDSADNVLVTGGSNGTMTDLETVKYDVNGNQSWNAITTKGSGGPGTGIVVDPSGNAYVAAKSASTTTLTTEYDPKGDQLWTNLLGMQSQPSAITFDSLGDVCVASVSINGGIYASMLDRYSGSGSLVAENTYNSGTNDYPTSLAADSMGNVVVAGATANFTEFLTLKYGPLASAPVVSAGGNQTLAVPHDGHPADNTMSFTLNGSASAQDSGTLSYVWTLGNTVVGTSPSVTLTEPVGTYTFTLTVTDSFSGLSASSPATVMINPQVDTPPSATSESVSLNENTSTGITLEGVDTYGDQLEYFISNPSHGTLAFGPGSTLTYTPATGFFGPDSFTYFVIDPYGEVSNQATVSITVNFVDTPPVAQNQSVSTHSGTPITLVATSPYGKALTYSIVSGPTHGALSGTAPNVTYTPAANYNGPDSFTFKANDGTDNSNVATVSITVTDQNPIAGNVSASTKKGTAVTISVLGSDSDPDGDPLTITSFTQSANGSVVKNANNTFTFTPSKTFTSGSTTFTYTINDNHGGYATGTVTVTVSK